MWFYVIYLFFIILLAGRYRLSTNSKVLNKSLGFNLAVISIIIISSLRYNIGWDWNAYLEIVYPKYYMANLNAYEPLNRVYFYLAAVTRMPIVMYSLFAISIYGVIGKAIKDNSICLYESLIIYYSLFYIDSLSILRQMTAVSVVLYGYRYIKEKKILKYLLCCYIASLYHSTAIISIFLYFIYYQKVTTVMFMSVICIIFFTVLLPKVLSALGLYKFTKYLVGGKLANSSGNYTRVVYTLLYLYCLLLRPKINREYNGFLNICTLGIIFPWILGGHTGTRLSYYFLIYYVFLLPKCNKRFDIKYRVVFLIFFYIYFLLLIFVASKSGTGEYVPFRWYFFESLNQPLN